MKEICRHIINNEEKIIILATTKELRNIWSCALIGLREMEELTETQLPETRKALTELQKIIIK